MKLSKEILRILQQRYFLKDEREWDDIAKRVSKLYEPIYPYIRDMIFIPSSPTLMNSCTNNERSGTLSSCFIMGIEDSIDSIMDSMKEAALVQKMCGGTGFNWSVLRGSNEIVKSTQKTSGGVMSFIGIFDAILNGVIQGSARRGAGMSLLNVDHPDILQFINAKKDIEKYTRSNFSVKIPNRFYEVLEKNPDRIFKTVNVVDKKENVLKDSEGNEVTYRKLWDTIIDNARGHGEPGIFNGDIARDQCTCKHISTDVAPNPCAEYLGLKYFSCNLGSINLSKLVNENGFEWKGLDELIKYAVRFFNKVIDKNKYPIKKIEEETLKARPIGLGCMGLAHLFYKLGIPYNSIGANELASKIVRTMTLTAMRESVKMAEKNKPYEYFDYKTFMSANERFWGDDTKELEADIKKYGCYNSSETSIAPTGSISFIANTSGGIEPVFGLVYSRKIEKAHKTYDTVYVIDPVFEEYVDKNLKDKKDKIYKYIAENKGSCQGCNDIPEDMRKVFVVAGDLTPDEHLDMLASVANVTSLSVSKTINLPSSATKKDISDVYLKAYKKGIIGVTVYRDGCREGILIHDSPNVKLDRPERITRVMAPKRPDDLPCDIYDMKVNGKRFVVLIGFLNESLYEIFVTEDKKEKIDLERYKKAIIRKKKKNQYDLITDDDSVLIEDIGDTFDVMDSSLSRLVSMSLRHGVPLQFVCDQLDRSKNFGGFSKAVMRIIKKYISEGEKVLSGEKCSLCSGELIYSEGCKRCINCGDGHCG